MKIGKKKCFVAFYFNAKEDLIMLHWTQGEHSSFSKALHFVFICMSTSERKLVAYNWIQVSSECAYWDKSVLSSTVVSF